MWRDALGEDAGAGDRGSGIVELRQKPGMGWSARTIPNVLQYSEIIGGAQPARREARSANHLAANASRIDAFGGGAGQIGSRAPQRWESTRARK